VEKTIKVAEYWNTQKQVGPPPDPMLCSWDLDGDAALEGHSHAGANALVDGVGQGICSFLKGARMAAQSPAMMPLPSLYPISPQLCGHQPPSSRELPGVCTFDAGRLASRTGAFGPLPARVLPPASCLVSGMRHQRRNHCHLKTAVCAKLKQLLVTQ
jgi:hypothetical protein